jgi:hypothetical protein
MDVDDNSPSLSPPFPEQRGDSFRYKTRSSSVQDHSLIGDSHLYDLSEEESD